MPHFIPCADALKHQSHELGWRHVRIEFNM
jgi:hypothetical protein